MWRLQDLMTQCRHGADGWSNDGAEQILQCQNPVTTILLAAEGDPHMEDNVYGYWITGGPVCDEHKGEEPGGVDCPSVAIPAGRFLELVGGRDG